MCDIFQQTDVQHQQLNKYLTFDISQTVKFADLHNHQIDVYVLDCKTKSTNFT